MAILDSILDPVQIQMNDGSLAIVDAIDADDYIMSPKWVARKKKSGVYAGRFVKPFIKRRGTGQYLHVVILERILGRSMTKGEKVDHIDGNTLNCKRSNLRLATHRQNIRNSKLSTANKSGYKGVMVIKGYWVAKITINYKNYTLGRYETAKDAGIAYNKVAAACFGEFARLNPIDNWQTITPVRLGNRKRKIELDYIKGQAA